MNLNIFKNPSSTPPNMSPNSLVSSSIHLGSFGLLCVVWCDFVLLPLRWFYWMSPESNVVWCLAAWSRMHSLQSDSFAIRLANRWNEIGRSMTTTAANTQPMFILLLTDYSSVVYIFNEMSTTMIEQNEILRNQKWIFQWLKCLEHLPLHLRQKRVKKFIAYEVFVACVFGVLPGHVVNDTETISERISNSPLIRSIAITKKYIHKWI